MIVDKSADKTHLFAQERHAQILALLKKRGKLLTDELCERFSVSPATIRNDLNELERGGLLKRTHGGAIGLSKTGFEANTLQKEVRASREKELIAKAAATCVEDGDTLAIDTGTTTMAFARELKGKKNLTVITNDIRIAAYLDEQTEHQVILAGGLLRKGFFCTTGTLVNQTIRQFHVDKSFLAANGVSVSSGLTTPDVGHAEIKRTLAEIGAAVYVLCDSGKIGSDSFATVIPINTVDYLITDEGLDSEQIAALESAGVEIILAGGEKDE